jgi:hypothetical protein
MNTFMAILAVVMVGLIGVATVICAGFGFYIMVNALIDRLQGYVRRKKPMATSVDPDELQLRRLKKAVAIRIAQRKAAN